MLQKGALSSAFSTYWQDMNLCRANKAYWCLLHVTICLPDICAALQSNTGETSGGLYKKWCDQFLNDPRLTGAEAWEMRCKVLHQGRATTTKPGRYYGFAFGQPALNGTVDHKRINGNVLHLDVGMFSDEMKQAVEKWIHHIESNLQSTQAVAVEKNLSSLVKVTSVRIRAPSGPSGGGFQISTIIKTH